MTVDGRSVPIGQIQLSFSYFPDDDPPYTWLDIHSDSDDDALGGVAINCLYVGNVPTLEELLSKTLTFADTDESSGSELRESVFWRPGNDTLELQTLSLRIEPGSSNV